MSLKKAKFRPISDLINPCILKLLSKETILSYFLQETFSVFVFEMSLKIWYKGKKQKIDADFLNKFGINLD